MDWRSRRSGCGKVVNSAAVSTFPQPEYLVLKVLYQPLKVVRPFYRKILALSTNTPALLSSSTPEQVKTETPQGQLSVHEKKIAIAEMLMTNNGCTLPCFMGVEMNQSNLVDIQTIFSTYMGQGLITEYKQTNEVVYGKGFETENLIRGEFKVHLFRDKADGIDFYLGGLWRPEVKIEEWDPYTLRGVFSQLGRPSKIRLYTTGPPNETSSEGIILNYILYYEQMNTVIVYFGQKTEVEPYLQFCPMQQKPEYMEMHMGYYARNDAVVGVSLEDVSSLSLDNFYNLDWNDPNRCININMDAFK